MADTVEVLSAGVHVNFEVRQVLLLLKKKKKLKFRKQVLKTWIKPMYSRGKLWEVASIYNCLATSHHVWSLLFTEIVLSGTQRDS